MCDICSLAMKKLSKLWRHQTYLIRNYFRRWMRENMRFHDKAGQQMTACCNCKNRLSHGCTRWAQGHRMTLTSPHHIWILEQIIELENEATSLISYLKAELEFIWMEIRLRIVLQSKHINKSKYQPWALSLRYWYCKDTRRFRAICIIGKDVLNPSGRA